VFVLDRQAFDKETSPSAPRCSTSGRRRTARSHRLRHHQTIVGGVERRLNSIMDQIADPDWLRVPCETRW
jgi:hypothetical protein